MVQHLKGSIEDRLQRQDRIGRRCEYDLTCTFNAMYMVTFIRPDPDTGEKTGEPRKLKSCSLHRKRFATDWEADVLEMEYLGPHQPKPPNPPSA